MNWDGKTDRRRHRRAPIRIISEFGDPGSEVRVETADFSAGGFACWMNHPVQSLTKLGIRFEFPSFGEEPGRPIDCEAVVVRCERGRPEQKGWLVAAAFLGLRGDDKEFIERYVNWHEAVMSPGASEEDAVQPLEGHTATPE